MNQVLEIEEAQENKQVDPKWRNQYMWISTGAIGPGVFLWDTEEESVKAALSRSNPELTEYLGAFPEGE